MPGNNPVSRAILACIEASGLSPNFINTERCWWLAYVVWVQVRNTEIVEKPTHCLIRYEGKLYDAEHPEGYEDGESANG